MPIFPIFTLKSPTPESLDSASFKRTQMQSPRLRDEAIDQSAIGPRNREVAAPMGCVVPSRTAAKSNTAHRKRSGSRGSV
jgi:hypothetical protein